MKGIRVLSLLGKDLNGRIGKKGAEGDITIYAYKHDEVAVELIEPTLYPDKIHPLVFGLAMCDFVLFKPDVSADGFAEMLASLVIAGKPGAFVGDASAIAGYVKGSPLEKWETLEEDPIPIRERTFKVQSSWKPGEVKIAIDQVFSLKSIGVVVLGAIARGTIKVHDSMMIMPLGKEVQVKSLQLHDANVEEISEGNRVGANIKGLEADLIERGSVLGKGIVGGSKFKAEIACPKFVKDGIKAGRKVFAYVGLQYCEASLSGDVAAGAKNVVEIELTKQFAYEQGDDVFVVDPGRRPRIIGSGRIV